MNNYISMEPEKLERLRTQLRQQITEAGFIPTEHRDIIVDMAVKMVQDGLDSMERVAGSIDHPSVLVTACTLAFSIVSSHLQSLEEASKAYAESMGGSTKHANLTI